MAQVIQRRLEDAVDELQDLISRGVLEEDEVREVIKRRRNYEFSCMSSSGGGGASGGGDVSSRNFLMYIQYEANLLSLLRHRCTSLLHTTQTALKMYRRNYHLLSKGEKESVGDEKLSSVKKKKKKHKDTPVVLASDVKKNQLKRKIASKERRVSRLRDTLSAVTRTGIRRIYALILRMLHKHSSSLPLWYTSIDLLLQIGASRLLQRFLFQAVQRHPRCPSLWILSADRLLAQGEIHAARRLLLQSLRFSPKCVSLWVELLKLESLTLLKAIQASLLEEQNAKGRKQRLLYSSSPANADEEKKNQNDSKSVTPDGEADTMRKSDVSDQSEEVKSLKCQGEALAIVFKGALSKLSEKGSPRDEVRTKKRELSNRGGGGVDDEVRRRGEGEKEKDSSTLRNEKDDISINANLHCFLYQSLMICLNLQASVTAQTSSCSSSLHDSSLAVLSPFQNLLTSMLHQSTAIQPLFKVYEWKVQLLHAVSSQSSSPGEQGEGEGKDGEEEEKRRHLSQLAEVQKVLKNIFAECCVNSYLLLLFSLFLRAIYLSEPVTELNNRNSPSVTADTECPYTSSSPSPLTLEDSNNTVEFVLDVDGEEDVEEEDEEGKKMSNLSKREKGRDHDNEEMKSPTEEGQPPSTQSVEEGEDDILSLHTSNHKSWHDRDVNKSLELLSGCLFPEIAVLLREEASIPSACLLQFAAGNCDPTEDHDETRNGEGKEIDQQNPRRKKFSSSSESLLVADSHVLAKQRSLLRSVLFPWQVRGAGEKKAGGESVTKVHHIEENRNHRLWLLRCTYTALVQLLLQQKKKAKREGKRRQEDILVLQETIAVTASLIKLIIVDSLSSMVLNAEAGEDREEIIFLSSLKQVSRDLCHLIQDAHDTYPCVRLFLLVHDNKHEVLKTVSLLTGWRRRDSTGDVTDQKMKTILLSQLTRGKAEKQDEKKEEETMCLSLSRHLAQMFSFEEGEEESEDEEEDEEEEEEDHKMPSLYHDTSARWHPSDKNEGKLTLGLKEDKKILENVKKFLKVWKKQQERRSELYFPLTVTKTSKDQENSKYLSQDDSYALLCALIRRCWRLQALERRKQNERFALERRQPFSSRGEDDNDDVEEERDGGVEASSFAWFREILEVSQPQFSYRLTQAFLRGLASHASFLSLYPSTNFLEEELEISSLCRQKVKKDEKEEDLFLLQKGGSCSVVLKYLFSEVFHCLSLDTATRLLSVLATCEFVLGRIWACVRESLEGIRRQERTGPSSGSTRRRKSSRRVPAPSHQEGKRERNEEDREEEEDEEGREDQVNEFKDDVCLSSRREKRKWTASRNEDLWSIRERKRKILMWLLYAQKFLEIAVDIFERCGVCTRPDETASNPFLKIACLPGERRGIKINNQKSPLVQKLLQIIPDLFSLHEYWWTEFWRFTQFCEVFRSQNSLRFDDIFSLPLPSTFTMLDTYVNGSRCDGRRGCWWSSVGETRHNSRQHGGGFPCLGNKACDWISTEEVERQASVALGGGGGGIVDFLGVVTGEGKCLKAADGKSCQVCPSSSRAWCLYTGV